MYRESFQLKKNPFSMSPDPGLLYLTGQHREALAGLLYTVLKCKGMAVLTGEAGTGKTTLLRRVLRDLPGDRIPSSIIFNPTLTADELLEMALMGFGIRDIPATKPQRLRRLEGFLLEANAGGRVPLLAVDEAHVLSRELLEEIRLLSNFELADRKLLQIVLIGQDELTALLEKENLRQLKQRIAVRLSILPLSGSETEAYISFRWTECGGCKPPPFSIEALSAIGALSQGIPRIINALCDNALMAAYGHGVSKVTAQHVQEAGLDLKLKEPASGTVAQSSPEAPESARAPVPTGTIGPVRIFSAYSSDPPRKSLLWRWARMGVSG